MEYRKLTFSFIAGAHLAEETQGAGRAGELTSKKNHFLNTHNIPIQREKNIFFFVSIFPCRNLILFPIRSVAPKGIVGTCVCSAIVGIAYLLALLFAIPNVALFVENNSGENEAINLAVATYQLAVPQRGALALTILLLLNLYFAGMSSITVTSRIGYRTLFLTIE